MEHAGARQRFHLQAAERLFNISEKRIGTAAFRPLESTEANHQRAEARSTLRSSERQHHIRFDLQ